MTVAEKIFLMIFSAFRLPVKEDSFDNVFRKKIKKENELNELISSFK